LCLDCERSAIMIGHTNPFSGYTNYSGKSIYPVAHGETRGICSGCPGEHLDKIKSAGCQNCKRRGMGRSDCTDPTTYVPIDPEQRRDTKTPNQWTDRKRQDCAWPGCTYQVVRGYCSKPGTPQHGQLVNCRRHAWRKEHGKNSEPPLEWLHREPDRVSKKRR
jgi:hypothetical protein